MALLERLFMIMLLGMLPFKGGESSNSIIYIESKFITINFIKNTITVSYGSSEKVNGIIFTDEERQTIKESYEKNKIGRFRGIYAYPNCKWTMPSFEDQIIVYNKHKTQAEILYNSKPGCKVAVKGISVKQKKIEDFIKCLKTILAQKQEYLNAKKILEKMKKDNPHVLFI